MEDEVIRCNQCMAVFVDDEIKIYDDEEVCPKCGELGCLMDMAGYWWQ